MIILDRNYGCSSNVVFNFDFGRQVFDIDAQAFALNEDETRLILVGNHQLELIHFDPSLASSVNGINDDQSIRIPYQTNLQTIPLFDFCNVNRPIVQWNHHDGRQFALAIDRFVRFYSIDDKRVNETATTIDTQHKRPISTISYWPYDPHALLTGSLDGQIQLWDVRLTAFKTPPSLKLTISTPLCIRNIQWPSMSADKLNTAVNSNLLAVQCDRCVRIYDMRYPDTYVSSIEHAQRIVNIDWIRNHQAILTLSVDNSIKIFSTDGRLLAESVTSESHKMSKVKATYLDNVIVAASRDPMSSSFGLVSWRWDGDQRIRPMSDCILTSTSSPIVDFSFVSTPKFTNLFHQISSLQTSEATASRVPVLTWCYDEQLRLIEMDYDFRRAYQEYNRLKRRQRTRSANRTSLTRSTMEIIEDEANYSDEADHDADSFIELSPSKMNTSFTCNVADEVDLNNNSLDRSIQIPNSLSIENELNALTENYGPYIHVESRDENRHLCIIRCAYPFDNQSGTFRIYLFLCRHYPIISQLVVRFKLNTLEHVDERFKIFQQRIQSVLDETSSKCFYYGHLCLNTCLLKLKTFYQSSIKQEQISVEKRSRRRQKSRTDNSNYHDDFEVFHELFSGKINRNLFSNSISDINVSPNYQNKENSYALTPTTRAVRRTCGARFSGGNNLICFGRTITSPTEPSSAPVQLTTTTDSKFQRPHPLHIRSMSLTVSRTQSNSVVDDQARSFRLSTSSTKTLQISNNSHPMRSPMFSAPVRSSFTGSTVSEHHFIGSPLGSRRRKINSVHHSNSVVSIYDLSILSPVSKKLADEYKIDFENPIDMCGKNERVTQNMAKEELAHCWHLLRGLLHIQSELPSNDTWFQTPLAQGLIDYLVKHYINAGDIQSASMFLLTMTKTPFMKHIKDSQLYHPILYGYASVLHRWKHFFKRTQIVRHIDVSCSSTSSNNPSSTRIQCSICSQPVIGQYILCPACGHGGHLTHIHQWFQCTHTKHNYCPEKDCSCFCLTKHHDILVNNLNHQQTVPLLSSNGVPRIHTYSQMGATSPVSKSIRS